ncbi:hypothetical protein GIB67_015954 [Kingdonia uniflora]|uniref:TF-B3 domain-containing protein n=1 Tax=Kingdonia uniflora TaxID=39325 RepID=A0A7J7PCD4_9MAGN|nr:hypothetical protein GIB67_015954 [Kingdonia uniflora]
MGTNPKGRSSKPSFFKVLVGDFSKQLSIPSAFIKHFNGKLLRKSFLRGPTGKSWPISMKKVNDDLFIHEGWQAFVRDHSLEIGDFLVFRYSGNSKFSVKMYDRTCCEKMSLADENVDRTNSCMDKSKHKQTAGLVCCVNVTTYRKKEQSCPTKQYVSKEVKSMRAPIIKVERKGATEILCSGKSIKRNLRYPATDEIKEENKTACFMNSDNKRDIMTEGEDCFSAVCKTSRKYRMTAPRDLEAKLDLKRKASVMLQDPQGKSWPVGITAWIDGRTNLAKESPICQKSQRSGIKHPSFTVKMSRTYLRRKQVYIPASFYKKNLTNKQKKFKLRGPDGRMWKAEFSFGRAAYVSGGWSAFLVEYSIQEDNICLFELLKITDKVLLQVSIS